jgi:hypothetical protein
MGAHPHRCMGKSTERGSHKFEDALALCDGMRCTGRPHADQRRTNRRIQGPVVVITHIVALRGSAGVSPGRMVRRSIRQISRAASEV